MMMKNDDGGPAFPVAGYSAFYGLSVRDYFAAKALIAFLGSKQALNAMADTLPRDANGEEIKAHIAGLCYDMADAMIAAREK